MAAGKEKKKSKINTWKPKKNQILVEPDGKLYVCHFDKIFGNPKLKGYNRFIINKSSYENKLGLITQYTNFFMNFYDPDDELALAYLKCKFTLDNEKRFNEENMDSFIEFIYEVMFTPSIINKIYQLVDDNYLDDIESDTEAKKKFLKNEKKHLESLEFTNQHVKALLRISFGMKIMSPVLFHYLSINVIKITKDSFVIFKFYQKLFDIFAYGDNFELCDKDGEVIEENITPETMKEILSKSNRIEKVNDGPTVLYYRPLGTFYRHTKIEIYNKIYCYVKAKVLESHSNNTLIFEQREIFGSDVFTVINQFTKKILISESMVKYMFNENIIGLTNLLGSSKTSLIAGTF